MRFHFTGQAFIITTNYWAIDNVQVSQCAPQDDGLVAGTVTDHDTGKPLDGAQVAAAAGTGRPGVSAPHS